jgi:molecular chaperone GrpE
LEEEKKKETKEELRKEINDLKYLCAELDNWKKHHIDDYGKGFAEGISYVAEMLLPIYDAADAAEKVIADEGVKIIKNKVLDVFTKVGIAEIKALNEKFDPHLHNAVASGEKGEEVLEVWQTGFTYQGKTLRPSMVKTN